MCSLKLEEHCTTACPVTMFTKSQRKEKLEAARVTSIGIVAESPLTVGTNDQLVLADLKTRGHGADRGRLVQTFPSPET